MQSNSTESIFSATAETAVTGLSTVMDTATENPSTSNLLTNSTKATFSVHNVTKMIHTVGKNDSVNMKTTRAIIANGTGSMAKSSNTTSKALTGSHLTTAPLNNTRITAGPHVTHATPNGTQVTSKLTTQAFLKSNGTRTKKNKSTSKPEQLLARSSHKQWKCQPRRCDRSHFRNYQLY